MRRLSIVMFAIAGLAAASAPVRAAGDDEEDEDARDDEDRGDEDRDRDRDQKDEGDEAERRDDGGGDSGEGGDEGGGGGEVEEKETFERGEDNFRPGGGGDTSKNSFLQGRFFIDKVDTEKTQGSTLVQGSLTSSNFYYLERGAELGGTAGMVGVKTSSPYARMFTDLRAQLDAMHIGGSRWDFRLDGRTRFVNNPGSNSIQGDDFGTRVQSGLSGRNEYELRELWLVRGGERADIFFGRQYIQDLGAIKIDGLRLDYASSSQLTLLGFAGAYPNRVSRSIGFDYLEGKDESGNRIGRVIPFAGGAGAAYRTEHTYGSFGGVTIVPFKGGEQPRVYLTSNGYWRRGSTIDLYHFVIFDVYGSAGVALTNLSLGANFKPAQRIRANLAVHRVDTETLTTVAQSFLNDPDPAAPTLIRNDVRVYRIAADQARGGLSVALGKLQQLEVSTSLAYRRRPEVHLYDQDDNSTAGDQFLSASQSVEVLFQLLHRNLFRGLRVGIDGSRVFGVGGGAAYARSASFTGRLFMAREFADGRAEWEAEGAYTTATDKNADITCAPGSSVDTCYGSSHLKLYEVGGVVYYRLRRDLFGVAMLNLGTYSLTAKDPNTGMVVDDPALITVAGYLRLAYRF